MRACEVVRNGTGMPAMFNDDVKVISLLSSGKTLMDARNGGVNGCVEVNAQGCDNMASTGYVNLPKCLELALNDGVDPRTGRQLGPRTGDTAGFDSFEQVFDAWRGQLHHVLEVKLAGNETIRRMYAETMPAPFLSLLTVTKQIY